MNVWCDPHIYIQVLVPNFICVCALALSYKQVYTCAGCVHVCCTMNSAKMVRMQWCTMIYCKPRSLQFLSCAQSPRLVLMMINKHAWKLLNVAWSTGSVNNPPCIGFQFKCICNFLALELEFWLARCTVLIRETSCFALQLPPEGWYT